MKHTDTLTVLRTCNSLVNLIDGAGITISPKRYPHVTSWSHVLQFIDAARAFQAAMQYVAELPEPAALAAAFKAPRRKSKARRKQRRAKNSI